MRNGTNTRQEEIIMNVKNQQSATNAFIMSRNLSVPGMKCKDCEHAILNTLCELEGVLEVTPNLQLKRVKITYDAATIGFDEIAQTFIDMGYPLENTLWTRIRYGVYRFVDDNAFANARVPSSPCCSNPKSICAKRQK